MRWITRAVSIILAVSLLIFWLLPASRRSAAMLWVECLLITSCALYLSFAYHRFLGDWRGFGVVSVGLFLSLAWLRWPSAIFPGRNVNLVIGLLAWALFVAVSISSILLLIRKDASLIFMGAAWLLIPLILLLVGRQYGQMERLVQAPLAEQTLWGVPLTWALAMLCLGPPGFFAHCVILLVKELSSH